MTSLQKTKESNLAAGFFQNVNHRTTIIRSLLPEQSGRLLDVGCGPVASDYPYADKALQITCIDWNLQMASAAPPHIKGLSGNFIEIDLEPNTYDSIIAADVFEHILLEQETLFVNKCVSALKPGGRIIISVPHQGTFAYLDPYRVKPGIHYLLSQLHLYSRVHNGYCDIRKGHKHYVLQELINKFHPLTLSQVVYFGYLFDPLLSWAVALSRGTNRIPGFTWLQKGYSREFARDYGPRAFNVAVSFSKLPTHCD